MLDFIVIGAQKSGTTTLFEYLVRHPQLCLPASKEAPFFNGGARYGGDWTRYLQIELGFADPNSRWGTVTPQYMYGTSGSGRPADVRTTPRRIHERLPDVKLIAILRDPVERARSHHAMALLDGWDTRSFDEAVRELLEPEMLASSRREVHENTSYVTFGEYARILSGYLEVFRREQLLVLFTEELDDTPHAMVRRVCEFLDVDPEFVPDNIGKHYHQSGAAPRLRWLDLYRWQMAASSSRILRTAWHRVPEPTRRSIDLRYRGINYRVRIWNRRGWRRRDGRDVESNAETDRLLAEHFEADARLLSELVGLTPPWAIRAQRPPRPLKRL